MRRFNLPLRPAVVNPPGGRRPDGQAIAARAAALRDDLEVRTAPVLLSLGRLVARKGFDRVLRSAAVLRARFPGLAVIVAGDGPERKPLESLARDLGLEQSVRMTGAVDELTKWALYDLCDLFVMPNRLLGGADWEGFGIVFVEAALASRAVVGGRNGGVPDAVEEGVTGVLVDPEDQAALTSAIEHLLADDGLRGRMGRAGKDRARTRFSGEVVAREFRSQLGWA